MQRRIRRGGSRCQGKYRRNVSGFQRINTRPPVSRTVTPTVGVRTESVDRRRQRCRINLSQTEPYTANKVKEIEPEVR
jgi:hypothetical protein